MSDHIYILFLGPKFKLLISSKTLLVLCCFPRPKLKKYLDGLGKLSAVILESFCFVNLVSIHNERAELPFCGLSDGLWFSLPTVSFNWLCLNFGGLYKKIEFTALNESFVVDVVSGIFWSPLSCCYFHISAFLLPLAFAVMWR